MKIATAPRNRVMIILRKLQVKLLNAPKRLIRANRVSRPPKNLSVFPIVENLDILGDLINRISWYLPNNATVTLPCAPAIKQAVEHGASIPIPSSQQRYFNALPANIRLVNANDYSFDDFDLILNWDINKAWRLGMALTRMQIVDRNSYSRVESDNWSNLYHNTLSPDQQQELRDKSKSIYSEFILAHKNCEKSYIFTTGPSIDRASEFSYEENSLKIVCNSMVKNTDLLNYINPSLLVFADSVFHFSPCQYDAVFRRHVLDVVSKYDCYCIVPEWRYGLMLAHYPSLANRLIGMPIMDSPEWNFPSLDRFFVKGTANIMTLFMVPVAAAISKQINILGADGRERSENYFWKHSSKNQFEDLMQTVEDTHPSFFRDRIYTDYYNEHCAVIQSQMSQGEGEGLKFTTLTESFIPALAKHNSKKCKD